ncbi:iron-sulfur cluster biosynthesis family protein [Maridesulfovibrio sp.]|jgi:Fe-S cluster assembly iron-binding protein IscA|uniref:iron-sulfur cluster biosynthesis family protein n=1 Tax=Maridesulfovibrio sp. TaxID=2795000 RepID=UPI0029CA12D9|nr:iron-sulfur cluster biosynthesis family protein [Maridesulfovibrio sp.]
MLKITEKAKEVLDQHFEGKEKETVRIYLASACSGTRLALGIDSAKDGDETINLEGYDFVVDKELLEQAKPMVIDLTPMGIEISSSLVLEEAQGSCGSCCGGCG